MKKMIGGDKISVDMQMLWLLCINSNNLFSFFLNLFSNEYRILDEKFIWRFPEFFRPKSDRFHFFLT